jgi:uncharacterized membrane protein HdeD (DUF308 family)
MTTIATILGIILLAWGIAQIIKQHSKPRKFRGWMRDCK